MSILQLKKIRIEKGISQEQLADLIGMTQSNYSRRENGKKNITEQEWKKIAKALNINVEDIFRSDAVLLEVSLEERPAIDQNLTLISEYIHKLENENAMLKEKLKIFLKET